MLLFLRILDARKITPSFIFEPPNSNMKMRKLAKPENQLTGPKTEGVGSLGKLPMPAAHANLQ
jgi:hypothetical protein